MLDWWCVSVQATAVQCPVQWVVSVYGIAYVKFFSVPYTFVDGNMMYMAGPCIGRYRIPDDLKRFLSCHS